MITVETCAVKILSLSVCVCVYWTNNGYAHMLYCHVCHTHICQYPILAFNSHLFNFIVVVVVQIKNNGMGYNTG